MSRPDQSAPARTPRPGRGLAIRSGWSRRLGAALVLLPFLFGSAGLAAPCAPDPAGCKSGRCGGPACSGCAGSEGVSGLRPDEAGALARTSVGCTCGEAPAEEPILLATVIERGTSRPTAHAALPARAAGGLREPTLFEASGCLSASPPASGAPLHLRNCVFRI